MEVPVNLCAACRFHSKEPRRKAIEVGDGELELVSFEDELYDMIICREPSRKHVEMGFVDQNPGADCPLFDAGKKGLDPALERLLARRDNN